jgi:hypothetical protein
MNTELTEIKKYEIDKTFEMKERISIQRFEMSSLIKVGNENLASISLLADKFSKAGDLIPKEFQNSPEKCFAAIYKGASLGLDAFTSLQRIAVVNGRATIWGDTALALVTKSGKLQHFKEYYGVWTDEKNMTKEEKEEPENALILAGYGGFVRKSNTMQFENKKFGAGCEVIREGKKLVFSFFSVEDAITAGLWGTNVWKKYPQRMIKYRPRAYALRDTFPDVLDGLYLKEEMEGSEKFKNVTPPEPQAEHPKNDFAKLKGLAWGKDDIKNDFPAAPLEREKAIVKTKSYDEILEELGYCDSLEDFKNFQNSTHKDILCLKKESPEDYRRLSAMINAQEKDLELNINLNQL